ncbi:NAD(P)/FAD-dependent oxidoreductase [Falsiroseomonas sp.]|uniref:NAD(P)/FAD-dependent oxidoreductase n=1 Tax=Falsiroseomonas sp. TaxID=2870721 RepID=UPI003565C4B0
MGRSADSHRDSLWSATAEEPAAEARSLVGEATAEVAVIGGGYTGLSAALNLAEAGARVTLVEGREIGWGGSGRNGGQVIPGVKLDPSELRARFGEERGAALASSVGASADAVFARIARHAIRCAPVRHGWIQAAHAAPALARVQRRGAEWQQAGAPVEMLDARAIAARTGTEEYVGGWRDGRAGTVHPLSYARGLARAARAAGATLHADSPAQRLVREQGGWRIETPRGALRARSVVVATNAYTDGLVPGLAKTLLTLQSIQIATAPLREPLAARILPGGECVSETRRLAFYFRRSPDGRLILGGRGAAGEEERAALFRALRGALARLYPEAARLPIEYRWSGQVALTLDGMPRVHEPAPGLFVGLGYNGRGVAMATLMGEWLAARIHAGREAPLPRTDIAPIAWHAARKPAIALGIAWAWARDRMGFAG